TEKAIDQALEEDRFSDAANLLYQFVWNDVCDWYVELAKPVIYGPVSPERSATQLVLAQTLNRMMRLLHPFVPFITEELYSKLPIKTEALIVETYPTPRRDKEWLAMGSKEAAFEMSVVKEVITAIRNIRGENQIKPGIEMPVRLAPSDARVAKILEGNRAQITRLAKLKTLDIGDAGSLAKTAVSPVRLPEASVDVIVPLEGLVDIAEEVKRIQKNIEKAQKDFEVLSKKLSNENFVKNAPPELLAADKVTMESVKERLERLNASLARLS
ncbi:MAG: valine--tRNA ligase, partial [Proteobacteria bacterium]